MSNSNNAAINFFLEKFIVEHQTEFSTILDIGCVGSEYAGFAIAHCDEYHGMDIRSHSLDKHIHHQTNFRYTTNFKPRPHLVICVNTLEQFGLAVERSHAEIGYSFQKMYKWCLDGLFVTASYCNAGRSRSKIYLTSTTLQAMLNSVPEEQINVKFFTNGKQVSRVIADLSTLEEDTICIIDVNKLASLSVDVVN